MRGRTTGRPKRSFVFVSESKLSGFLRQIDDRTRLSVLEMLQPSFEFDLSPFKASVQPQPAGKLARERSQDVQVAMVEKIIQDQYGIDDLTAETGWITGRADMELEPLADGASVLLFCGYAGPLLVALHGSVGHLTGYESLAIRPGSYSHALRDTLLRDLPLEALGRQLADAAQGMNLAPKPMRFLAEVTKRGPLEKGPQSEFVLATPLYVERASRKGESSDVMLPGTVHRFSADRGWGLILPDGDEDAIVIDGRTEPSDANETPLASGQRVEFRITHTPTGILASSVRRLDRPVDSITRGELLSPGDPSRIGDYEVLRRLGTGSMGVVYLGRDTNGTLVAIKVIRPEFVRTPEFLNRFQHEANIARRVRGPNIAQVIAAVTDAEQPYLVTEYVDGHTLEERLAAPEPLTHDSVIKIVAGVSAALEVIHRAGIIHRDLTPANVILTESGPKVIDFGIAQKLGSETKLTQHGWPVGTPAYMSPEQINEKRLTTASDIFSWAGITVFAATGHQPFGSKSSTWAWLLKTISQDPANLSGISSELRQIIEPALHKDPAWRPSAAEISASLRAYLAASERRPQATTSRKPRRSALIALAGLAVVIAAVIVTIILSRSENSITCPTGTQAGTYPVTMQNTSASTGVNLQICPVQVDHEKKPELRSYLSGIIVGRIPSAKTLIVVSQPVKSSCAEDGTPGSGSYYYIGSVIPKSDGSWHVVSGAYFPGAQAIQRRFYFLLGSSSAVNNFRESQGDSGAPEIGSGFQLLGSLTFTPVKPAYRYCSG